MIRRLGAPVAIGLIAAAAIGAGCGGGADTGTSTGANETTTLNVGVIPIADVAPLYVGIKKGFFADQKLKIVPHMAQGGAAIVPAVIAGDFQIGFSNAGSLLVGNTNGLPVQMIAPGDAAAATASKAWGGVLVSGDGGIEKPADLEGKTIAVNALKELNVVVAKAALAKEGVDVSTLKFTEIPFPEMAAALRSGRVDAIRAPEPFRSMAIGQGARVLVAGAVKLRPKMTWAAYFASRSFIADHPDVVERFVRAMDRALEYSRTHPRVVRKIIPTYTKLSGQLAQKIHLPLWTKDLNVASLHTLADVGLKYGLIDKQPDFAQLVWKGAQG